MTSQGILRRRAGFFGGGHAAPARRRAGRRRRRLGRPPDGGMEGLCSAVSWFAQGSVRFRLGVGAPRRPSGSPRSDGFEPPDPARAHRLTWSIVRQVGNLWTTAVGPDRRSNGAISRGDTRASPTAVGRSPELQPDTRPSTDGHDLPLSGRPATTVGSVETDTGCAAGRAPRPDRSRTTGDHARPRRRRRRARPSAQVITAPPTGRGRQLPGGEIVSTPTCSRSTRWPNACRCHAGPSTSSSGPASSPAFTSAAATGSAPRTSIATSPSSWMTVDGR